MAGIDVADGSDEGSGAARAEAERARLWTEIEAHRERLLRLSRRRTATAQDAEDCVQEALLRAMEFPDLDETRLGPFLTTVTVRLCADRHRERASEARLLQRIGLGVTDMPGPEDDVCERGEAAWLAATFDQLPRRQQQVVRAREAGLSCAEVASHLRMSYVSVESSLARARSRFRAALARATGAVPMAGWRWTVRSDVAALGAAGAVVIGVLLTAPSTPLPAAEPEAMAAPRRPVVIVAPSPRPSPSPTPVAAAPVAVRVSPPTSAPVMKRPKPSHSPSPTPSKWGTAPNGYSVGTDGNNGQYSQVERLLQCVQYGVEIEGLQCRYPEEESP